MGVVGGRDEARRGETKPGETRQDDETRRGRHDIDTTHACSVRVRCGVEDLSYDVDSEAEAPEPRSSLASVLGVPKRYGRAITALALSVAPRAHFSEQTCRGHADARNRPCYKSALSNEDRARQTHEISGFSDNLRELLVGKLDE